jgi:hypothetical protein
MKLSAKTIQILKNFSSINPSIMFKEGNILSTMSPLRTIIAKATIAETIERDFGIFDLNRFLGILSLFNEPDLFFTDTFVKITDGQKSVNFTYADPITITTPPEKEIKMSMPYVEFDLTSDLLQNVMRAASVLQLSEISLFSENGRMMMGAKDFKNPSNNSFEIDVKETDENFKIIFSCNNMKMMSNSYKACVAKGIGHFSSEDVEYFIVTESKSTYGVQ